MGTMQTQSYNIHNGVYPDVTIRKYWNKNITKKKSLVILLLTALYVTTYIHSTIFIYLCPTV